MYRAVLSLDLKVAMLTVISDITVISVISPFRKVIPNCRCGVTKGISGEIKSRWTALEDVCTARP